MKKLLLEAPILTRSGYGEHARLVFRSLRSKGDIEIFINPLEWGSTGWISEDSEERRAIESCIGRFGALIEQAKQAKQDPVFDYQVHVGIPNEFTKKAARSVCVTAGIETDRVSSDWLMKTHQGLDKLIVPSNHAKEGFIKTSYEVHNTQTDQKMLLSCNCPVDVIPYPVKDIKPEHLKFEVDTKFNFLSVALLGPRKNLERMIRWFMEEFKNDDVGLILKTARTSGSTMDKMITRDHLKSTLEPFKTTDHKCKVYLLHGDLSEEEVHSLYVRDDVHAYLTATHGEGYGLPVFEAVYSGLPVVATDWSGHLDFLSGDTKENNKVKNKKLFARVDYDLNKIPESVIWKNILVKDSQWAYPKEASFKRQMRNMFKNYGMYKKWASSLKEQSQQNFDKQKICDMMVESIFGSEQSIGQNKEEEVLIL
jgi:glycosyltransferase involved in cell wall biosynthesis